MKTIITVGFLAFTTISLFFFFRGRTVVVAPDIQSGTNIHGKQKKTIRAENTQNASSSAAVDLQMIPPAPVSGPKKIVPKTIPPAPLFTSPIPALPPPPSSAVKPASPPTTPMPAASTTLPAPVPTPSPVNPPPPALPPLDEAVLLRAVVKIECPAADNSGKYIGSGFVMAGERVVTAAHVIKDSGSAECTVIFPHERRPIHYLKGIIQDFSEIKKRHDEEGIDVAILKLPRFQDYDDARNIFKTEYPFIPYPVCENPAMLGDRLLHFGYPSNFLDQTYLQESKGEAIYYGNIEGIKDQQSSDGSYTYKTPILGYTKDESAIRAYMVSRVPTFYGDSGGLAFNAVKQCILGPHRGGTIGGGAGENYSVFSLLGWSGSQALIQD